MEHYNYDKMEYDSEHSQLREARIFIFETVDKNRKRLLDEKATTKQWLQDLTANSKPGNSHTMLLKSQLTYNEVMKKKGELVGWLKEWESVVAQGIQYDIP